MVGASIIGVQKITNSTAVRNSEIFSVGKKLEYRKSFQVAIQPYSIIYTLLYYPYKSKTFLNCKNVGSFPTFFVSQNFQLTY